MQQRTMVNSTDEMDDSSPLKSAERALVGVLRPLPRVEKREIAVWMT
jgi:hypothetical protein